MGFLCFVARLYFRIYLFFLSGRINSIKNKNEILKKQNQILKDKLKL